MNLIERVIKLLEDRKHNVESGNINCIPLPFSRFRDELPGIEQGVYYLISGQTKAAKTQITNYLFLFNSLLYSYSNPDKCSLRVYYYPLEETPEAITLRFMSYILYTLSGHKIRISPTDLKSTDSNKPLSQDILDVLNSEEYLQLFKYYEETVLFMEDRNPTGVYKTLKKYAEDSGTIYKKSKIYKDEFGIEKTAESFDYYKPNNPKEYVMIIIDHVSLLESERGLDLRQTINKLSEYMIILRNRYNYIPVIVQQQSTETSSLDAFKSGKIRPTMAGLADSKYTGKDCSVMLGITNPHSHELPSYLGYDITKFKGNIKFLEIVLNRNGKSNGICPLYFDGAVCQFDELPLPSDRDSIQKVYDYLETLRVKKTAKFFFMYSIKTIKNKIKKWQKS